MPYATVYQVAARNAARGTYTANTIPTASQVVEFLVESAAQVDAWLYNGGYAAPFDAAIASGAIGTTGQVLLQRWNIIGAALMVEQSAQQPMELDQFQKLWDEVKAATTNHDLPLPLTAGKSFPRGLGVPGSLGAATPQEFTFTNVPGPGTGGRSNWDL